MNRSIALPWPRALVAGALLASAAAQAQPLDIVNAGFEAQPIGAGLFAIGTPAGWQNYDPSGRLNGNTNSVGTIYPELGQSFFPAGAPEGNQAALVYLTGSNLNPAGIQQRLDHGLITLLDARYHVSVMVGNIASGISKPGSPDGGNVFYDLDGFPGFRIEVLAGNTVISARQNSVFIPEGEFREVSWSFEPWQFPGLKNELLTIRLLNLAQPGTLDAPGIEVDFDDVRMSVSFVPEPQTYALMAAGLAAMGLVRRRASQAGSVGAGERP